MKLQVLGRFDLKKLLNGPVVGALAGIGVGVALLLLNIPLGLRLIHLSYDMPFLFRPIIKPAEVVMVYMDEDSHRELGQPRGAAWDRGVHAKLLERLTADSAKAVVFDISFSDPNPAHPDGDERFARAIKANARVVLAAEYTSTAEGNPTMIPPYSPFAEGAAALGFDQLWVSQDFLVRRHLHVPGEKMADSYSSMTWEAANFVGASAANHPDARLRERWLNYYGPTGAGGVIPVVSFQRAIEMNEFCPSGFFSNKVVFVGGALASQFSGVRKDEYRTPYTSGGEFRPGVDIQATQFLNLVRADWLTRVRHSVEIFSVVLIGLVFGYGLALFRPRPATGLALLGALLIIILAQYIFWNYRVWFPWMILVAAQIPVALLWSIVFNSVQLYVQNKLYEASLEMYLSPKLVKKFATNRDLLKPGAKKETLTILFTDIANFTSISEGMDSDELAKHMNSYFETAVANCIHYTDGTIVKYIGDAIFSFWNAPDQQNDHKLRACEAAVAFRNLPPQYMNGQLLITRIGLHTGVANVGNFGSTARVDYTALGENINLAARMEGLNKYLGTIVLITSETHAGIEDKFTTRFLGNFRLKGFEKSVGVYELVGTPDKAESVRALHEAFAAALSLYQQKEFEQAEAAFQRVLEISPNDGPAKFYLKHIEELKVHPPPAKWGGDTELKEK